MAGRDQHSEGSYLDGYHFEDGKDQHNPGSYLDDRGSYLDGYHFGGNDFPGWNYDQQDSGQPLWLRQAGYIPQQPREIRTPVWGDPNKQIREIQGEPFNPTVKLLEGAAIGAGLYLARDAYLQGKRNRDAAYVASLPPERRAAALAAQRAAKSRKRTWGWGLLLGGALLAVIGMDASAVAWLGTIGIVLGIVGLWKLLTVH